MSKAQLKKVMSQMDADQIAGLVLELYDARPEAKEYLDFFVKPDIDAKLDKAKSALKKEFLRSARGRNRTRTTRLRRIIKDIASLNPGGEAVCELMTYTVETACTVGSDQLIKDVTQRGISGLLHDAIVEADRSGMLNAFLPRIEKAIRDMHPSDSRTAEFKSLMKQTLDNTLQGL